MDFHSILQNREARNGRHARPYAIFRENSDQCIAAGRDLIAGTNPFPHTRLLERSVVITFVTHIEVYFRDMLDWLFKYCAPDFFVPKLRHIHQQKYDIEEVLEIYRLSIHPLELVSSDQSFQSIEKIERVFSKFVGKSLWSEAINLKVRRRDQPEMVITFEAEYLKAMERVFQLRHQLVHNPRNAPHLTQLVLDDIKNSDGLMFAVDIILSNMLSQNKDPELGNEEEHKA